jgi:antirestriction protein ArdC
MVPRGLKRPTRLWHAANRGLYAKVSARIVAELEAGAAPWVRPWSATPGANTPCNAATNRPYSGCNVVLLWMAQAASYRTPRFLTFKQTLELGGNVRKGERGTKVYFVKQLRVRDQGEDDNSSARLHSGRCRDKLLASSVRRLVRLDERVVGDGDVFAAARCGFHHRVLRGDESAQ